MNNDEHERTAFEATIDANPLDATAHLVFADWLDDHNEPDEAAFRRSMGNWIHAMGSVPHTPERDPEFPWRAHYKTVPEGVPGRRLISWLPGNEDIERHRATGAPLVPPDPTYGYPHHLSRQVLRWRTYRDMEAAFRRVFLAQRLHASGR